MNQVITRKEAIALGLKKYFTGKECLRGHVERREQYVTVVVSNVPENVTQILLTRRKQEKYARKYHEELKQDPAMGRRTERICQKIS